GAGEPEDPKRIPAGPDRARLRYYRDGRQSAREPVRRSAEDDEADGRRDGPARSAQGHQVAEEQAQGYEGRGGPPSGRWWAAGRVPRRAAGPAARTGPGRL